MVHFLRGLCKKRQAMNGHQWKIHAQDIIIYIQVEKNKEADGQKDI